MLKFMATNFMIIPTHMSSFDGQSERETKLYCLQVHRTSLFLSILRNEYNNLEFKEQGDKKHKGSERNHEVSFQSRTTT